MSGEKKISKNTVQDIEQDISQDRDNDIGQNFASTTQWLEARNLMPKTAPGLEKMQEALGLYHEKFSLKLDPKKTFLIAGTNGKGSTSKALSTLLQKDSQNVGLYTSPHLISTTERIQWNNQPLSEERFLEEFNQLRFIIDQCELTHFESLTLTAYSFFSQQSSISDTSSWNLFEVGLGGTWDATNAIEHKHCILTPIGLDHQHILGSTLEEIAHNKFGIINHHSKVYTFGYKANYPESLSLNLQKKVKETDSVLYEFPEPELELHTNSHFLKYNIIKDSKYYVTSLLGQRGAENSALALEVFEKLGFTAEESSLEDIHWPGRLSPLCAQDCHCPFYISGDHNHQGLDSLIKTLEPSRNAKILFILGLSHGREHELFITELKKFPAADLILTQPKFRGADGSRFDIEYYEAASEALEVAKKRSHNYDFILATGSLYLCGELLTLDGPQSKSH